LPIAFFGAGFGIPIQEKKKKPLVSFAYILDKHYLLIITLYFNTALTSITPFSTGGMSTPVIVGITTGVAYIALFIIWSSHLGRFGKFIGQDDAVNAVKEQYSFLHSETLEPKFGHLKYEGECIGIDCNSERKFTWYAADPAFGGVLVFPHSKISIDFGDAIIRDYYVWTLAIMFQIDHISSS
jgi:hypothetical protein